MPRPRLENPRSVQVKMRMTEAEAEATKGAADAAGLSLSDFCRDRVLGVEQASGGEPRPEARPVATPAPAVAPSPPAPAERSQVVKLDKWLQGRTRMPASSCARMVARGLLTVDGVALRAVEVDVSALAGDVRLNGQKL